MGVFGHNGCSEIKVYSTLVAKWASHERRLFAARHTSTVRSNRAGFAVLSRFNTPDKALLRKFAGPVDDLTDGNVCAMDQARC